MKTTIVDQCIASLTMQRDYLSVAIEHLEAVQKLGIADLGGVVDTNIVGVRSSTPPRRGRGPGKNNQQQPRKSMPVMPTTSTPPNGNGKHTEDLRVWCRECNPPKEFKNAHGLGLHRTRIHFAGTEKSLIPSSLAAG